MIWKRWISLVVLLSLAVTWTGCETDGGHKAPEAPCSDDEVRVGNTLVISLLDIPEPITDKEFGVRTDGAINLPYLGSFVVTNKKFGDIEREIQKAYIDKKIFRQVTVVVKPGLRFYTVAGEVKSPSTQPYVGPTTVLRAIAACGDFTEFANRKKVEIHRANGKHEAVDCIKARKPGSGEDRSICPGDYIFVPKSL